MSKKICRYLFFLISFLFVYFGLNNTVCHAISAFPGIYDISQPTGQSFKANENGDEWQNWTTKSDDQSVIVQDTDGFWKYAKISYGKLEATDSRVGIDPTPSSQLKSSDWEDKINTFTEDSVIPKTYYAGSSVPSASSVPLQPAGSSQKILVLLVSFTDKTIQNTDAVWNNKFFGNSGQTVSNFYKENSGGSFIFSPASESFGTTNDGIVRVTLSYAHPNTAGNTDDRNRQIVKDALIAADPYINFSSYDTNGNGYIDINEAHIVTITAGYERSCGSTAPSVWGHRWALGWTVPAPQLDGKFVAQAPYGGYTQQGEIHSISGDHIATIGILCHELGHDLGLFDQYNTANAGDPSVGVSSLMASGSWGKAASDYPGGSPAHMDPWSKIFLGFTTPLDVSGGIQTVKSASLGQYNTLKIATSDVNQYFLVENRNTSGFDAGLYYEGIINGGVAIWHVDESVITANMASNTVNNNPAHRGLELERAVLGSNSAPYYRSGSGLMDTFSNTTSPNSTLYSGILTNISIKTLDPTGTSMRVLIGDLAGVQFSSANYSVGENTGSIALTVNRTGSTAGILTVDYTTSNGTAATGSDYTTTSGTLTFADGDASKTIIVPILDDSIYEGNENFTVTLSNVSDGDLVVPTATVTIVDNEVLPAKYYISPVELKCIGERTFPGTYLYYDFEVFRTINTSDISTVDYFTTDITAIAGLDYLPLSGTLTFAPGETKKKIRVTVYWDGELENDESFSLGLRNASSGVIVTDKSIILIDDIDIAFNSLNYTVQENSGNIILTVNRGLSNSDTAVSFKYTTVDGTATAGSDYTAKTGTVSFAVGQISQTISIPILDDVVFEGDETFTVNLTDVYLTEIKNPIATVTIRDNEIATAQIAFNPSSYTVNENSGSALLTVTRSIATTGIVSVNYTTTNGTATVGSDYSSSSGTLTFAAGETSKTITVPILDDAIYEGNEAFTVTLSNVSTGNITIPAATVTIVDNDIMPTNISISPTGVTFGGEGDGTSAYRDFTVTRSGNTSGSLTVDYSTSDITATSTVDYIPVSGTLTFSNGETQKTIRVTILWDGELEDTESFKLGLSNASSGVINNDTATIYINDIDIALDSINYTVQENLGNIILTMNRGLSHSGLISRFSYATLDGTAKAGTDYVGGSGTVTFAPGEMSKTITIPIMDDAVYEGDEIFTVTLTNVLMTQIKNPIATITINDNDTPTSQIAFDPTSYTVAEDNGNASLIVTRSLVTTGTVTVEYTITNGTASAGSDYSASSGTITFAPGETSKTITVPILDDAVYEGNETFNVTLSNPSTGSITVPAATVTVVENDPAPQITFSPASYSVAEDGGNVTISVYRSVTTAGAVSVDYSTVNGTASAGSDFTQASGTLSFADGETNKTITVSIADDTINEPAESFIVRLNNPKGGIIVTQDASITITDNEGTVTPSGIIVNIKPYVATGRVGACNVGSTQQLSILATFSNGVTMDISSLAVWNSQYPDVATVNGGLITGINPGITRISFTYGSQSYQFFYTIKSIDN